MNLQQYIRSYTDYFWEWTDSQQVVAIRDGQTIAFTNQLIEIMSSLSLQGFPRFGPLLLAIAATNNKSESALTSIMAHLEPYFDDKTTLYIAFEFLYLLGSLPKKLRQGRNRIILLQVIFEESHNRLSIKNSKGLLRKFLRINKKPDSFKAPENIRRGQPMSDLHILALLAKKFKTKEDIEDAMMGFTSIQDVIEEQLFDAESEGDEEDVDLITALLNNEETRKVGALIQHIWSTVNIPMRNRVSSDQPFGGVADITNKGTFDKLLTSEFANEDLIFMSRLANNEALFYNREAPPSKNDQTRVIIVDISLKNWGNVHVISMAMLLAICNNPKAEHDYICFGVGNQYYQFDVSDVRGVIEAMGKLNTPINAVEGLEELFKNIDTADKEVFFISLKSTANDLDVQKLLGEYNHPIDYWIHPESAGGIEVYKKHRTSKVLHQSLLLPVERLWKKPKEKPKNGPQLSNLLRTLLQHNADKESASLNLESSPFILNPAPGKCTRTYMLDDEIYKFLDKNRLLKKVGRYKDGICETPNKGYQIIPLYMPLGNERLVLGRNRRGHLIILALSENPKIIQFYNVQTYERYTRKFDFPGLDSSAVVYLNFGFYIISGSRYRKILLNGKLVATDLYEGIQRERMRNDKALKAFFNKSDNEEKTYTHFSEVGINGDSDLCIGKMRFNLHGTDGELKLKDIMMNYKITASASYAKDYSFEDGSTVNNLGFGVIKLVSSDSSIPTIYLPTSKGVNLAAATNEVFAGNEDFYRTDSETTGSYTKLRKIRMHNFYYDYIAEFTKTIVRYYDSKN